MRIRCWIMVLLLCSTSWAMADETGVIMTRYRQALERHSVTGLEALIAPQAQVVVTLDMPKQPLMVITLTRAEFLQQQRALWHFATSSQFDIMGVSQTQTADGTEVHFRQKAHYDLFHQSYDQDSELFLTVVSNTGEPEVTAMRVRTRLQ